jgi:hypothetical protein
MKSFQANTNPAATGHRPERLPAITFSADARYTSTKDILHGLGIGKAFLSPTVFDDPNLVLDGREIRGDESRVS